MKYNFDKIIDRKLGKCRKWDNKLLKEKFGVNEDAIPMDLADLDFECAPAIKKALVERASLGDYSYTYCYDEYYDAVIRWNKRRYHIDIEKDWIKLTFGTCSTLHYIVQCFCKPNDAVLVNTPAYDQFSGAVLHGDCRLVFNPLKLVDMRYYIDFELLEQQLCNEDIKMYIFCSPQNPSGRVWTKDDLYKVSELCLKYHVLLVCDEIHRDIVFDPESFTTLWNAHENIIHHSIMCISPNKGFGLGGLKSSYVIIENEEIRSQLTTYLQKVYVTSPHVFVIPALLAAYNESQDWLDELSLYIKGNFEILYAWFAKHMPKAKVMKADSSFLAWIDMQDVFVNENEMRDFFIKSNLTMEPGSNFVANGEGWLRLNIGTQRLILQEALHRMENTMKTFIFSKK